MTMILRLTDPVAGTLVDLVYHESLNRRYALARGAWAPAVAARRQSTLGGGGPYADVAEELAVHVLGDTVAEALANLGTLAQLLDQAEDWADGKTVNPVLVQYQPAGGAQLLSAALLGRAAGDETSGVSLPVTFNTRLAACMIANVRVRFVRRGQWLAPADTATGAYADNAAVMTAVLGAAAVSPAPCRVTLTLNPATLAVGGVSGYVLLLAKAATDIVVLEAETMAVGKFTAVADAANHARGGAVLRYTPTNTLEESAVSGALGLPADATAFAVYAVVRVNGGSTATAFSVRAGLNPATLNAGSTAWAPAVVVRQADAVTPAVVYLGTIAVAEAHNYLQLVVAVNDMTGAPTLDIDYVACLALDDQAARALVLGGVQNVWAMASAIVDPRALTAPAPITQSTAAAGTKTVGRRGDAFTVMLGTTVAGLWLCPGGLSWRLWNGAAAVQGRLELARNLAYLTPL